MTQMGRLAGRLNIGNSRRL